MNIFIGLQDFRLRRFTAVFIYSTKKNIERLPIVRHFHIVTFKCHLMEGDTYLHTNLLTDILVHFGNRNDSRKKRATKNKILATKKPVNHLIYLVVNDGRFD